MNAAQCLTFSFKLVGIRKPHRALASCPKRVIQGRSIRKRQSGPIGHNPDKFGRWSYNSAYHLGELSHAVLGEAFNPGRPKRAYGHWRGVLFAQTSPRLAATGLGALAALAQRVTCSLKADGQRDGRRVRPDRAGSGNAHERAAQGLGKMEGERAAGVSWHLHITDRRTLIRLSTHVTTQASGSRPTRCRYAVMGQARPPPWRTHSMSLAAVR